MRRISVATGVLLGLLSAAASAQMRTANDKPLPWGLIGQPGVVTLVDLHPDPKRNTLSSVNYQQQGFLPLCTPVEVLALNGWKMKFRVIETGVEFDFKFHASTLVGTRQALLDKYFGTQCPRARVDALSELDREGIRTGSVAAGMSKDAVIFALGYPPAHATASLDLDQWRFWRSRARTMLVIFKDGVVAEIKK